jgi:hypothetical protein
MSVAATSREEVQRLFGRNCIAALPSGRAMERFTTPKGEPLLVYRNPTRGALDRMMADGDTRIRFWLSPCGRNCYAWKAGDVTHFQLYGDLEYEGWIQSSINFGRDELPIVGTLDDLADVMLESRAVSRLAGGPFLLHTTLRTLRSDVDGPARDASGMLATP